MENKFRVELLNNNPLFRETFNNLLNSGEIAEYSDKLWKIILRDKTPIRINGEPLAFKDLFHLNLNEGRCRVCAFELVLLLDKLGIYSEAVECVNDALIGTTGSSYGGHWYVEAVMDEKTLCIDTSLVITGNSAAFDELGHKIIKKYDIDTLFKQFPSLIDYYENMVINKNLL